MIGVITTTICQQTCYNIFNMYSNRIFTELNAQITYDKDKILANIGTQYFGIFSALSSLTAFYISARVGRRTLFIVGQTVMTLLLYAMTAYAMQQNGIMVLIMVCIFITAFYPTMHAAHWIYLPEILSDQQWGFILMIHYLNGIELSLTTEYMLHYLKPSGTFLFYGIVCTLGIFWFVCVIKETKGLSDKEKKALYLPMEFQDEENYVEICKQDTLQQDSEHNSK